MRLYIKIPYTTDPKFGSRINIDITYLATFMDNVKLNVLKECCELNNVPLILPFSLLAEKGNSLMHIRNYKTIFKNNQNKLTQKQINFLNNSLKDNNIYAWSYFYLTLYLNNLIDIYNYKDESSNRNFIDTLKIFLKINYRDSYGDDKILQEYTGTSILSGIKENKVLDRICNYVGRNGYLETCYLYMK
ncbi:MAG: hypothetical protein KatS3mg096_626 [Candidatus Parcubacteria bacterium]|nr:MAG: hypothetical protein KatS3mg096_626 [Candidatus Parcubacteria bacterium]